MTRTNPLPDSSAPSQRIAYLERELQLARQYAADLRAERDELKRDLAREQDRADIRLDRVVELEDDRERMLEEVDRAREASGKEPKS